MSGKATQPWLAGALFALVAWTGQRPTSPALAGLLAVLVLREPTGGRQLIGIGLALAGAVLLSIQG